ncbi:MAG: hypothetical protein ACRD1V_09795 [Vicinamibacterales bacterium]
MIIEAVHEARSPLVLTERNEHLDRLESGLTGKAPHVVVRRSTVRYAVSDAAGLVARHDRPVRRPIALCLYDGKREVSVCDYADLKADLEVP